MDNEGENSGAAIKLIEKNTGITFSDINPISVLLHQYKATEIKAKINKWDLIKLKSFCTAKETTNKTNRQPTDWLFLKKIFANDVTKKGLISKTYKQLIQLSNKNKQPN